MKGTFLEKHYDDQAEVTATQDELREVLVSLIGNAIDAMPEGGRLYIRSRRFIHAVGTLQPGVHLFTADTGSGMNTAVLKKLFEPLFTTKGTSGTGLGLCLSQEILKKHGFRLSVKASLIVGPCFTSTCLKVS